MEILLFLILFPLVSAAILLFATKETTRSWIVKISALLIGAGTVLLLFTQYDKGILYFGINPEPVNLLMFILELAIAVYLLWLAILSRKFLVLVLILVETALIVWFESVSSSAAIVKFPLFIDQFSLIMALIVGIIGSLICVYSLGYMKTFYEQHPAYPNKTDTFFVLLFVFLAAMFGVVFSNSLTWIFFFWEVTTLCSFLLIGFTNTEEATNNAFTALWINILGGIAFAAAIVYLTYQPGGILSLDQILVSGKSIVLLPAILIGLAGLTKSAQFPFSGWLVGAMVAPTPVSALLHSSTMVKAGVYILIRFSPVFHGTASGMMIALVGATTFLLASAIAISQNNAKKVLAYSTIANLGLIVACAGIGTAEAVWAAILLIIFHAVAKSLLFLGTGIIEQQIGSRDIEEMGGLINHMPNVAVMMVIGIAGMFLAPFGMLIAKWAVIQAFISAPYGLVLVVILMFGSSLTVFFWTKWMGKLLVITPDAKNLEGVVDRNVWIALVSLAGLTIVTCLIFPIISKVLIEPFLLFNYDAVVRFTQDNVIILVMMMFLIVLLPLSILLPHRKGRTLPPYMGGIEVTGNHHYKTALGVNAEMKLANYYFDPWFGETKLTSVGICLCLIVIALMFAVVLLGGVLV